MTRLKVFQTHINRRRFRWFSNLEGHFQFGIEHKPGSRGCTGVISFNPLATSFLRLETLNGRAIISLQRHYSRALVIRGLHPLHEGGDAGEDCNAEENGRGGERALKLLRFHFLLL